MKVWLVGTGLMGKEFGKVLNYLDLDFQVIGRSEKSCNDFLKIFPDVIVHRGGIITPDISKQFSKEDIAIVAVNEIELKSVCESLIECGIKKILVEKPAGSSFEEVINLNTLANSNKVVINVAYNRRFYSSVLLAKKLIEKEGGVKSFNFEFTEWSHIIKNLKKPKRVLENWFLVNSIHVIDLAFFLGGAPKSMVSFTSGELDWHSKASAFSGAGVTFGGALFNYSANWASAGRWSVEILTSESRYILRPLEELKVQKIGSINVTDVEVANKMDIDFKPGFLMQCKAMINGEEMLSLNDHVKNLQIYKDILNGSESVNSY